MQIVIGIDNGLDGGAIVLEPKAAPVLFITPTLGDTKRTYDLAEMVRFLERYAPANLPMGVAVHVFLERAQAMPKQGVSSTFSTGLGYGAWQGMLAFGRFPYTIVSPQMWQKPMFMGVTHNGDTKRASAMVAQRLHPGIDWRKSKRAKNPHDGLTDALCIAEWGKRALAPTMQVCA